MQWLNLEDNVNLLSLIGYFYCNLFFNLNSPKSFL